jgi:hypothetical protein
MRQYVSEPAGGLAKLERRIVGLEEQGRALLVKKAGERYGNALATLALFYFPPTDRWEPLYDAMPSDRDEKARGTLVAERAAPATGPL